MRKKVEKELERLQDLDIIRKAEDPTPWISPIVIVPKGNYEIRICIDNRCANQAIQRERHVTPTLDDLINDLNGAMVFSKIDLKNGYHQLELDEESKYITTFSTHIGIFQYNRLHFGINSASEIFQHQVTNLIQGIQAKNYSDDIIVYGKSETGNLQEARKNHDENLSNLLQRLKENNVTANAAKCSFHKTNLKFNGYIFSQDGISADPEKLQALKDVKPPQNAKEVRSFLGMANYIARFIPDFATISEPLRLLTHKNSTRKWGEAEKRSLNKIKISLTNKVSYFNPKLQTELVVDASPVGLGCLLTQKDSDNKVRVIAYASRALTPVEQRYSQIEREALAIIWATEHFHLYLFGTDFCIITDHKPLETIFTRTKSSPIKLELKDGF
ncbi:Zinc knuckle domain containing protein [Plakobranchus ocellatus]|uniref:Zinc knuckle domain containing protein n=1 Tax=Plakobranchus ocellatus TaxID=259542 RepID=A0AAV4CA06_9GAST|nr:Zinc knuckle domain containing protein [Plakobranchus ocellatus]